MYNNNLIFDLGFNNGDDTDFYLKKGFDVVAVEANPLLIDVGAKRFQKEIAGKNLVLLNKAVADKSGTTSFYIHPDNSEWSSCFPEIAQSDGSTATKVQVEAVSILDLFEQYGIPRYMKVDIEGHDLAVAQALLQLEMKPKYVSFETNKREYADLFAIIFIAGYKKFQLVNQLKNPLRHLENSVTEGKAIHYKFTPQSSGPFGLDLPADKWLTLDEAITRYVHYKELKKVDNQELGLGWLDLHAAL